MIEFSVIGMFVTVFGVFLLFCFLTLVWTPQFDEDKKTDDAKVFRKDASQLFFLFVMSAVLIGIGITIVKASL